MADFISPLDDSKFVYHVLRYTSDLVRDEWVNMGGLVFDPLTGALRPRLVEEQDESARIRRLQPTADEDVLRGFRDHLEDQFATYLRNRRAEQGGTPDAGEELQKLIENWNNTLSNGLQLAPQKGVHADDLDAELERLYTEHVAPPRKVIRVGAPGSRAMIRSYCSQVWKAAGLWDRIQKSVRVAEFTFPGDPMRIDYCYRRNGARGYVQTLSVSRAPADCKLLAYTAARIAARAPFASEFAAVADGSPPAGKERPFLLSPTPPGPGVGTPGAGHLSTLVPKLKTAIH